MGGNCTLRPESRPCWPQQPKDLLPHTCSTTQQHLPYSPHPRTSSQAVTGRAADLESSERTRLAGRGLLCPPSSRNQASSCPPTALDRAPARSQCHLPPRQCIAAPARPGLSPPCAPQMLDEGCLQFGQELAKGGQAGAWAAPQLVTRELLAECQGPEAEWLSGSDGAPPGAPGALPPVPEDEAAEFGAGPGSPGSAAGSPTTLLHEPGCSSPSARELSGLEDSYGSLPSTLSSPDGAPLQPAPDAACAVGAWGSPRQGFVNALHNPMYEGDAADACDAAAGGPSLEHELLVATPDGRSGAGGAPARMTPCGTPGADDAGATDAGTKPGSAGRAGLAERSRSLEAQLLGAAPSPLEAAALQQLRARLESLEVEVARLRCAGAWWAGWECAELVGCARVTGTLPLVWRQLAGRSRPESTSWGHASASTWPRQGSVHANAQTLQGREDGCRGPGGCAAGRSSTVVCGARGLSGGAAGCRAANSTGGLGAGTAACDDPAAVLPPRSSSPMPSPVTSVGGRLTMRACPPPCPAPPRPALPWNRRSASSACLRSSWMTRSSSWGRRCKRWSSWSTGWN